MAKKSSRRKRRTRREYSDDNPILPNQETTFVHRLLDAGSL